MQSTDYKLIWTDEALRDLENIVTHLRVNWSEQSVEKFSERLFKHLDAIKLSPLSFATSPFNHTLRRSVISKHNSILYEVRNNVIYVRHIYGNRRGPSNLRVVK